MLLLETQSMIGEEDNEKLNPVIRWASKILNRFPVKHVRNAATTDCRAIWEDRWLCGRTKCCLT